MGKDNAALQDPNYFLEHDPSFDGTFRAQLNKLYHELFRLPSSDAVSMVLPEKLVTDVTKVDLEQIWQQLAIVNTECQHVVENNFETLKFSSVEDEFDEKLDDMTGRQPQEIEGLSDNDAGSDRSENILSDLELPDSEEDDEADTFSDVMAPIDDDSEGGNQSEDEDQVGDGVSSNDAMSNVRKYPTSVVDDQFFKIGEMEEFLELEDKKYEQQDQNQFAGSGAKDNADDFGYLFEETPSDAEQDDMDANYEAFFDPPARSMDQLDQVPTKRKSVSFADMPNGTNLQGSAGNDEAGEDTETHESATSYERIKARMERVIQDMEEENLGEKAWHLKGEIAADSRPENSTLDENLDFTQTNRAPIKITEDFTKSLENKILQRIRDKAWDNVERKKKPVADPVKYKNQLILDQEKSKVSLSQIYEQEWIKQTQGSGEEMVEKKNPAHVEIERKLEELFRKLDALSHFHYTPMEPLPEISVVSNLPSVMLEEVAPTTSSDHQILAPQDVQARSRTEIKERVEMTTTDKKRERRLKKKVKHLKAKNSEKKLAKKDHISQLRKIGKIRKPKPTADSGKLVSSKEFFGRLEDSIKNGRSKKTKATGQSLPSAAYKL